MDRLLPANPFADFPVAAYPTDFQGWGFAHPIFERAIELVKPKVIVEVGSWKGMSAINMALTTKKLGLDSCVICIDTWLGSAEHIRNPKTNKWTPSLKMRWGYPSIYYTFAANVIAKECHDVILPIPTTSEIGAKILKPAGLQAEIIYIDGSHEYEPVIRDLVDYWDLLAPNGLLIGDDYQLPYKGVIRAAKEFAAKHSLKLVTGGGKFLLGKGEIPADLEQLFSTLEDRTQPAREEDPELRKKIA